MIVYRAILKAQARVMLQYRAAALAGVATQFFWGLLRISLFAAFYASATQAAPISLPDITTYLWLIQALFALSMWSADREVQTRVSQGVFAYELTRPLDLYGVWFAQQLANRLVPTLLRAVPLVFCAGLFWGLKPPASWLSAMLFLVSFVGAGALAAACSALATAFLLFRIHSDLIMRLAPALTWLLSGMMIPIPLLPKSLQIACYFLPFRGMIDTPLRLYLDHFSPQERLIALAHQGVWLVLLIGMGRLMLAKGTQRTLLEGG